jgi:hypothetical protein
MTVMYFNPGCLHAMNDLAGVFAASRRNEFFQNVWLV